MEFSFLEILILVLLGVLFFKEQLTPMVTKMAGRLLGIEQKSADSLPGEISRGVSEVSADFRNALQPLLYQMERLAQYTNHDTTESLQRLMAGQGELRSTQKMQCQKLDRIVESLDDIQRNGIRIRK